MRTCIGCRARRPPGELVRLVRTPEGDLRVGRAEPGRGAWVCAGTMPACVDRAARRKAFGRALRGEVLPAAIDRLRAYAAERERMDGRGR